MYAGFHTYVCNYICLFSLANLSYIYVIIRSAKRTVRVEKSVFFPCNSFTPWDGAFVRARSWGGGTDKVGSLPHRHRHTTPEMLQGSRPWPGCPLVLSLGICMPNQSLCSAPGHGLGPADHIDQQSANCRKVKADGPRQEKIEFLGGTWCWARLETSCSAPEARGRSLALNSS